MQGATVSFYRWLVEPGSLFSAVRDLGLKLTVGKAPVDVLVVDAINRPSEN
jgi:uncharacterized protein (TIGR03435 family)